MSQNTLEKGSLVLVTGANGFLGSHIVDQLLAKGYRVRGTVRDVSKQDWLVKLFDDRHGKGKFELVQVADFSKEGCLDDAVKGCSAIAHTASDLSFKPDPNLIVTPVVELTKNALAAAAKEPGVKRFVLTSSSTAATRPYPNKKFHVDKNSWNEADVEAAWAPPPYEPARAWAVYGASKTQGEQAAWEFVKTNKPQFTLNTILPNANFGQILDSKHQEGSTSGWIRAILNGGFEKLSSVPPQWYVDPVDTALLHVAALTDLSVEGERIMAFAEPYNWNRILGILRKLKPHADIPKDIEDDSKDLSIVDTELSVRLLKNMGQDGFKTLEQSLKDLLDSLE